MKTRGRVNCGFRIADCGLCKTNPIPGGRDTPPFYCSIIPPCPAGPGGTPPEGPGTGVVVQTNPICRRPRQGASTVREKSYGELDMQKASTKQSQFPAVPGGTGPQGRGTREKCAKQSQKAVVGRQWPAGGCTNKPNFRAKPGGTRPQGRGTTGKCTKRSQSARRGRAVFPRPSTLFASPSAGVRPGFRLPWRRLR